VTPRALTGLGIACALGVGADAFFRAMRESPKPLAQRPRETVTSFDASKLDAPPIVEVPSFDPTKYLGDKGLRTLDRLTKLLVVAARLCLHDAGFKKDGQWVESAPERVGVCCSNAYGSLEAITELDRVAKLEDARYINPAKFPNTVSNSASGYVSIWEDLRALNVSVSDGNCGALDAVECADVFLSGARADAILTGGGEAMSEALFLAFEKIGALAEARLGEGAAFFSLETVENAKRRGAKVLGEAIGYGTAFLAPKEESTLIFASSQSIERAIAQALSDAGVTSVDLVASSLSGIAIFDDPEREALAKALPGVPVAAPKLLFGETLGAGGAMGIAAALAWLGGGAQRGAEYGAASPSAMVSGDAPKDPKTVLVTAVGYYGNASALVVRAPG
jgi:3-oxoacyl-(acyl-carrier-protein) synthase